MIHLPRQSVLVTTQTTLLALPVVLFLLAAWSRRWITDDGFIYLRVVDQITRGNGPVFNAGERVEAFTGPIWLGLLTLVDISLPWQLTWLTILLSLVCIGVGLGLAVAGAAILARRHAPHALLAPFGILVPLAMVAAWTFATSGLESPLVVAWLGACLFILARWATQDRPLPVYGAVLLGLGWLIRPELAVYSALFIVGVLVMQYRQDSWGARLRILIAAAALPAAYQLFRMGYYGTVVANSAIAKDASDANWLLGWLYASHFASPYWLWLALLIVLVGGYMPLARGLIQAQARRAVAVAALFVAGALLNALYIIGSGGDWLHGRLLLPALYALIMPVAVIPLIRAHTLAALIIPWVLICAFMLSPRFADDWGQWRSNITLEDYGWHAEGPRLTQFSEDGFYYDRGFALDFIRIDLPRPAPELEIPAAAIGGIGASGYALGPDWYLIDLWGLAEPLTARLISTPPADDAPFPFRLPGHEKPLPTVWLAAMITEPGSYPDPGTFPRRDNPLIPETTGETFRQQIDQARTVLECPPLKELSDAIRGPLDLRRFYLNVTGAWSRTWLRIPPDPDQAYEHLCP